MATILLLHSVRGLREVERSAADLLRSAGHDVVTPDLYDGEIAATLDEGFAIEARLWPDILHRRAEQAADGLPPDAVLAGLSMGADVATHLWRRRPETAGVLLLHGLGAPPDAPRPGVPVQLHLAEPDEFVPEEGVAAWRAAAARSDVTAEVFRYPGPGHLFTDPSLPDYDAGATALLWRRAAAFLNTL